ncbi:MAG: hypothetical protein H0V34_05935 [Gammaproteobacteria bacterium]|nr:hypothetical protein [Gammaproteobacteria bacterium]
MSEQQTAMRALTLTALIVTTPGAPAVSFDVGEDVELKFSGRLMLDSKIATTDPADTRDFDVRRARLGFGVEWDDWEFRVRANFPDGELGLNDLRLDYEGFDDVGLRLGLMQEPFSMVVLESSNDLTLMERPLPAAFAPSYNFGADMGTRGEYWGARIGAYGPFIDSPAIADPDDDYALTGRITGTPWRRDNLLVHVGGALSFRRPPDDDEVDFSSDPESFLLEDLIISSRDAEETDDYVLTGLEFALRANSRLLRTEYIRADIDQEDDEEDDPDAGYWGYYVEGNWILTGERRDYSTSNGIFYGVEPERPVRLRSLSSPLELFTRGAWELAARYSYVDFEDGEELDGDRGEAFALGLNWYPMEHVKLMLNGVHVQREESDGDKTDESLVQTRLQYFF